MRGIRARWASRKRWGRQVIRGNLGRWGKQVILGNRRSRVGWVTREILHIREMLAILVRTSLTPKSTRTIKGIRTTWVIRIIKAIKATWVAQISKVTRVI
jgi:hypothetical protein